MFSDVVTVFNHYKSHLGDVWYPSVIHGANINLDKAAIKAKFGAESKDNVVLNVRYMNVSGKKMVGGKEWLPPKEWKRQTNDLLAESITFASGTDFDFFMLGAYPITEPIKDEDYKNGFFDEVKKEYDYVFAITSVANYSVIPHFEIMGA